MGKIRVIVAEEQQGSAAPSGLLRAVLEREGVEVVGEVLTPFELIELAADEQPDAVVFATGAPQAELDRLRTVAPASKIVFVSPILVAAEAELAEAVVERADVLASLGPVLVHLCTPGRMNARRALTESFDRPDWIDRVRKDPVTLREILSESPREEDAERPSVTSLQDEARAVDPAAVLAGDLELIRLPDLEAEAAAPEVAHPGPQTQPDTRPERRATDADRRSQDRRRDDPVVILPQTRTRRRRRLGLWSLALMALGLLSLAVLPSTVPAALEAAPDGAAISLPDGTTAGADRGGERAQPPQRDPAGAEAGLTVSDPGGGRGGGGTRDEPQSDSGGGGSGGGGGAEVPGGDHQGGGGNTGQMPGSSAEHNPHGGPPGQSGEHPAPGGPLLV
jgi:hypothetical protein